jgi:hypothetical protein
VRSGQDFNIGAKITGPSVDREHGGPMLGYGGRDDPNHHHCDPVTLMAIDDGDLRVRQGRALVHPRRASRQEQSKAQDEPEQAA